MTPSFKELWKLKGFRFDFLHRFLSNTSIFVIGLLYFGLVRSPFEHEVEYMQALITASSIAMGIAGVLLTIARFGQSKDESLKLFGTRLKYSLIWSILYGFAALVIMLIWYTNPTMVLLQWASVLFLGQTTNIVLFLLFPQFYTR